MSDTTDAEEVLLIGGVIEIIGHPEAESLGVSLLLTTLPRHGDVKRFEARMSAADAIQLGTQLVETGQKLRGTLQ